MKYEKDYVYKKKPEYEELSLKDWMIKSLEDGDLYPLFTAENDEELFKEFLETVPEFDDDNVNNNNLKEINNHKKEVIEILKDYMDDLVKPDSKQIEKEMFSYIDDWEKQDEFFLYQWTNKSLLEAKRNAITELYNKYCK